MQFLMFLRVTVPSSAPSCRPKIMAIPPGLLDPGDKGTTIPQNAENNTRGTWQSLGMQPFYNVAVRNSDPTNSILTDTQIAIRFKQSCCYCNQFYISQCTYSQLCTFTILPLHYLHIPGNEYNSCEMTSNPVTQVFNCLENTPVKLWGI